MSTQYLSQPIAPTTVIVSSQFVLIADCLWRTPLSVIKEELDSTPTLPRLHRVGLRLIPLSFVSGGVDQARIANTSGLKTCPDLYLVHVHIYTKLLVPYS